LTTWTIFQGKCLSNLKRIHKFERKINENGHNVVHYDEFKVLCHTNIIAGSRIVRKVKESALEVNSNNFDSEVSDVEPFGDTNTALDDSPWSSTVEDEEPNSGQSPSTEKQHKIPICIVCKLQMVTRGAFTCGHQGCYRVFVGGNSKT